MLSLVVSSTGYASVAPLAAVQQRAASPTMFGKAELEGARALHATPAQLSQFLELPSMPFGQCAAC